MTTLAGSPLSHDEPRADEPQAGMTEPWPLLLWALVVTVALLSYFVHLVHEQVERGERLRESQRQYSVLMAQRSAARAVPPRMPVNTRP